MSKSPFGWSYPPGAENDPSAPYNQDADNGITAMQDDVFSILDGYIPTKYIDEILKLIAMGEQELYAAEQAAEAEALAEQHSEDQRLAREYQEWREQNCDQED
jgi:hypothetical protein